MGRFETEVLATEENLALGSFRAMDRPQDKIAPRQRSEGFRVFLLSCGCVAFRYTCVSAFRAVALGLVVFQESIAHLLSRPVGRPPNHVRRYYASFSYQAGSWERKRRIVAKVEWHPGELYPRGVRS